jgi:hypothetical protein
MFLNEGFDLAFTEVYDDLVFWLNIRTIFFCELWFLHTIVCSKSVHVIGWSLTNMQVNYLKKLIFISAHVISVHCLEMFNT